MTYALNIYNACNGYKNARKTADWAKNNPDQWETVSTILAMRMKEMKANKHGNT